MNDKIKILSIETSCDETAVSVLEYDHNNGKYLILADSLNSQIDIHKEYGGVFPTVAKREHGNNLLSLLKNCLEKIDTSDIEINIENMEIEILSREEDLKKQIENIFKDNSTNILKTVPQIDYIAVTRGPGLEPALWVGLSFAKFLAKLWQKPLLPINHMEGHISSVLLENNVEEFPTLALLISGGHTELVDMENWGKYRIIGKTRDDAIGEAYDKVARILGLPYPGGPEIAKKAQYIRDLYNENHIKALKEINKIKLPRPMINSQDLDLSFSGLKTAVLYLVRDIGELNEEMINLISHEFENAVLEVLIKKLNFAHRENDHKYKNLIVAGGVIANEFLKHEIAKWCIIKEINFLKPDKKLATDNAVMIGLAAIIGLSHNYVKILDPKSEEFINLKPDGDWSIDNI